MMHRLRATLRTALIWTLCASLWAPPASAGPICRDALSSLRSSMRELFANRKKEIRITPERMSLDRLAQVSPEAVKERVAALLSWPEEQRQEWSRNFLADLKAGKEISGEDYLAYYGLHMPEKGASIWDFFLKNELRKRTLLPRPKVVIIPIDLTNDAVNERAILSGFNYMWDLFNKRSKDPIVRWTMLNALRTMFGILMKGPDRVTDQTTNPGRWQTAFWTLPKVVGGKKSGGYEQRLRNRLFLDSATEGLRHDSSQLLTPEEKKEWSEQNILGIFLDRARAGGTTQDAVRFYGRFFAWALKLGAAASAVFIYFLKPWSSALDSVVKPGSVHMPKNLADYVGPFDMLDVDQSVYTIWPDDGTPNPCDPSGQLKIRRDEILNKEKQTGQFACEQGQIWTEFYTQFEDAIQASATKMGTIDPRFPTDEDASEGLRMNNCIYWVLPKLISARAPQTEKLREAMKKQALQGRSSLACDPHSKIADLIHKAGGPRRLNDQQKAEVEALVDGYFYEGFLDHSACYQYAVTSQPIKP